MKLVHNNPLEDFNSRLLLTTISNVLRMQMSPQEFIDLPSHALQRDHEMRMPKMKSIFDLKLPTLYLHFPVIQVTKGFNFKIGSTGENVYIETGFYKADRHTTAEYWKKFPDTIPNFDITVDVIQVDNAELYKAVYDSYNSMESVDNSSNKIQGGLRILGMRDKVTSNVVRNGSFGSALNIAYTESKDRDRSDDIIEKLSYFRDEIIWLDSMGAFNMSATELRFQTMYASLLMFTKRYLTKDTTSDNYIKLEKAVRTICQMPDKESLKHSDKKWDGVTALLYEVFNNGEKGWVPTDALRKTSFATVNPQMSFFLYCLIEMTMQDKLYDYRRGFKPVFWLSYQETSDSEPTSYYKYIANNI